jgi:hypothetical protein
MLATVPGRETARAPGEFSDDVHESVETVHAAAIEALWRAG